VDSVLEGSEGPDDRYVEADLRARATSDGVEFVFAIARQVSHVVMDAHPATGIRRVIEGELTASVRRRLRGTATLDLIAAPAGPRQAP
jgi:hypothetical protein